MATKLVLGPESFWEMAVLAVAGRLASCQSCVEHFYFQSKQNAVAFLDSCAAGGLVVRVSLLDLYGDLGARAKPTLRQQWYDQSIYISAAAFRSRHLDSARQRIERTRDSVYSAFKLYYERLGADDDSINAAYAHALQQGRLRHSDVARAREDVDFSAVAKLRLILDSFRYIASKDNLKLTHDELETQTIAFVLEFVGSREQSIAVSDHAWELEEFIVCFLSGQYDLAGFWKAQYGAEPTGFRTQCLPVVRELIRRRRDDLLFTGGPEASAQFTSRVITEVTRAVSSVADDEYRSVLSDLGEDLAASRFEYGSVLVSPSAVQPSMNSRHS